MRLNEFTMTQAEAVEKASAFLLLHMGRSPEPLSITLSGIGSGPRRWNAVYRQESFLPEEANRGVIMDGPYVLRIDDATGEVSVQG
jgi:hypothetical protein